MDPPNKTKKTKTHKKKCFSVCANIGIFSQLFLSLIKRNNLNNNLNNTLRAGGAARDTNTITTLIIIITARNECMRAREI
jgi:hypothetical protein